MIRPHGFEQVSVVGADKIDYTFADEIVREPGGEHLYTCSSCGTCAATCLVRRYNPAFNPRLVILKALLGLRDEVLAGPELWECSACDACYPRCPQKLHISDVMGAMRNIAVRNGYKRPGETATVSVLTCTACGMCVQTCPYKAISLQTVSHNRRPKRVAQVEATLCLGCGICNSVCPSSSIAVKGHNDTQMHRDLVAGSRTASAAGVGDAGPGLVAIVCDWCLHTRLDLRGASSPPAGVRLIRVPCAGRVSPLLVMTALKEGAEAVLTIGCKEGECHYKQGSTLSSARLEALGQLLAMMGVERGRVRLARMGALDRGRFIALTQQLAHSAQEHSATVRGRQGG